MQEESDRSMIDIREYEQLARETGAYRDIELDILKETLQTWKSKPGEPYTILDLRDGRTLAGFAVLSRAANTDFTFDVPTICIDRAYIGKGVGIRLVEMLEEEALRLVSQAILRFEISHRKEEAVGVGLFLEAGYALIGHIEDFYETGDDYFIYAKHLRRAETAPAPPSGSAETGREEGSVEASPSG